MPTIEASRADIAIGRLLTAAASRRHTVQWMRDPLRYEVIFAGKGPHPSKDERSGEYVAIVFVEEDGTLRLVEGNEACQAAVREEGGSDDE
jgi:hypothetical protein